MTAIKKTREAGGWIEDTYFVYSAVTGGLVFKDDVTDTKSTDYASIGPVSVRLENGSTPVYTHADHLGSPVASTDASNALLWREHYMPFGETLNTASGSNDDNTGYTGHVEDAITGLTYMQARYFDPLIGRFYSTDPVDYYDQLNLYAYGPNDPVNGTDPNGMVWGKIARFGGKVLKYKGDVKRAGKETITEIGSAVKTFGDGKLDLNDAAAAFDLVSPVSTKEVKAGAKGLRGSLRGAGKGKKSDSGDGVASSASTGKKISDAGLVGGGGGALVGAVSGGLTAVENCNNASCAATTVTAHTLGGAATGASGAAAFAAAPALTASVIAGTTAYLTSKFTKENEELGMEQND